LAPKTFIHTVLGFLCALAVCELALRVFVTPLPTDDSIRGLTYRQYHEGIATSHFGSDGERLTGNDALPNANNVVILGDSNVEGWGVSDDQTMGSIAERTLRGRGAPVNIHQYWLEGATSAQYAHAAPQILQRWPSSSIVVVLTRGNVLFGGVGPLRISTDAAGTPAVIDDRKPPSPLSWRAQLRRRLMKHSVLFQEGYRHALDFFRENSAGSNIPGDAEWHSMLSPTLKLLREAYGDRLVIVYDPYLEGTHIEADNDKEKDFLQTCERFSVRCASSTMHLLTARYNTGRLTRGFSNTVPGEGHLNHYGHEALAQVIVTALADRHFPER
jgi:hypothetical protein